jgi:hypothetical protein
MEYARQHHSGHVAVSPLSGDYKLPDLSSLVSFSWVEHLTVQHADMLDISALSQLRQLRYLQLSGAPKQALNLSNYSQLTELRIDWWSKLQLGTALSSLRALSLSGYSPASGDLTALPEMPLLVDLEFVNSRKLLLSGIERFPLLKRLTIDYFPKLTDLSPLAALECGVLETLEFGNCPRLADHAQISAIKSLQRLAFNGCGEIPTLRFLDELPALESFSFVGTNILDGDLSPCLRLRFAGFFDKRHYSHRSSDFPPARYRASSSAITA